MNAVITCEDRDGIRVVTLNRPERSNAVDAILHRRLAESWREPLPATVGAVVITGAGRAFSAGGDLAYLDRLRVDPQERRASLGEVRDILLGMIRCPVPVIAAVNGAAIGLGCSIALAADVVVMADDAVLADPHVVVGLTAGDGGPVLWPLLSGLAIARWHLLSGEAIAAEDARRCGLVLDVVPRELVLARAMERAAKLASLPRMAVQTTKQVLNLHVEAAAERVLDRALASEFECFDTEEVADAIRRFGLPPAGQDDDQ